MSMDNKKCRMQSFDPNGVQDKNAECRILAIETSCDETAAAVLEVTSNKRQVTSIKILSNIVSSQIKLHSKYGGVYPELASREHIKNILPVIKQAIYSQFPNKSQLSNSQIEKLNHLKLNKNLKFKIKNCFDGIDAIAVTTGPGLIGSLLVGVNTAKTLSYVFKKPLIPVNHLEGHIYANFITDKISVGTKSQITNNKQVLNHKFQFSKQLNNVTIEQCNNLPKFPILALVVSGGHTNLVYMKKHLDYKIIGETCDDAAGEAYDKVASMLNLGYPGGPIIDAIASKIQNSKFKIQNLPKFPRPMINENNFDFSFSGLKTSVLYYLKKQKKPFSKKLIKQICYEFQEAVTDVLVVKTLRAAKKYRVKSILLGGGVAANSCLREKMKFEIDNLNIENSLKIKNCLSAELAGKLKIDLYIPPIKYCTDNAAIMGVVAAYKIIADKKSKWYDVKADSNLKLE